MRPLCEEGRPLHSLFPLIKMMHLLAQQVHLLPFGSQHQGGVGTDCIGESTCHFASKQSLTSRSLGGSEHLSLWLFQTKARLAPTSWLSLSSSAPSLLVPVLFNCSNPWRHRFRLTIYRCCRRLSTRWHRVCNTKEPRHPFPCLIWWLLWESLKGQEDVYVEHLFILKAYVPVVIWAYFVGAQATPNI